jgi:mRNA interferase RelE/StbE
MRFIPRRDLGRVVSRIAPLASNPRPTGCEKLSGQERYRLRQGACRIVYAIDDTAKTVDVVAVARRRDVYR